MNAKASDFNLLRSLLMRENLIINGDMLVSQRGDFTTPTPGSDGLYTVDRWKNSVPGTLNTFEHVSVNQPVALTGSKSLKVVSTAAQTGQVGANQFMEDDGALLQQVLGRTITVSAYVKSNSANARVSLFSNGAPGVVAQAVHSGGGQWERLVVTGIFPASTTVNTQIRIGVHDATTTNVTLFNGEYIEFTGVKVELGQEATPFISRGEPLEKSLCLRYFEASFSDWSSFVDTASWTTFLRDNSGNGQITNEFKSEKRIAPVMAFYKEGSGTLGTWRLYNQSAGSHSDVAVTPIGISTRVFRITNSAGADTVSVIRGHWTADADF